MIPWDLGEKPNVFVRGNGHFGGKINAKIWDRKRIGVKAWDVKGLAHKQI
jgi:hypothetical protein